MRLSDVMGSAGLAIYPEIGLVIFLIVFAAITVRVFARKNRESLKQQASIVLDEEKNGARNGNQS